MFDRKIYNTQNQKDLRRSLRKNSTWAEQRLWQFLRNKQLGIKFSRQVGIKNYIVDFCARKHKLIIELDGSIHDSQQKAEQDIFRQQELEKFGFKILRFKNNQIFENIDLVIKEIIATISPSARAPREGEGVRG
jgi:very-short-patch-repair endonuclease